MRAILLTLILVASLAQSSDARPRLKDWRFWTGTAVYYFGTYKDAASTRALIRRGGCEANPILRGPDGCSFREGRYWLLNVGMYGALTFFEKRHGNFTLAFRASLGGAHVWAWRHNEGLRR
ncbi:MAG TPA: hypothetical protein VF747_01010 [Blastocatellia bacterium]|jgi:hypothetical protein